MSLLPLVLAKADPAAPKNLGDAGFVGRAVGYLEAIVQTYDRRGWRIPMENLSMRESIRRQPLGYGVRCL